MEPDSKPYNLSGTMYRIYSECVNVNGMHCQRYQERLAASTVGRFGKKKIVKIYMYSILNGPHILIISDADLIHKIYSDIKNCYRG